MTIRQLLRPIQTTLFDSRPMLLTNSFLDNSPLKLRVQMLINPQTNRRALWRYLFVMPVAALLLMCSQKDAVENELPAPIVGEIFTVVEQNPEPRGGMSSLMSYMGDNITYPEAAQKANVSGKVFVSFVVAKDGHIADVQILKGIGYGCDQEAVRVVRQMPRWTPGRQNGKPVNVKFNLPINFSLNKGEAKADSDVVTEFTAKFDRFVVNGKVVDKATFTKAFGRNPKEISSDPARRRISITTR